MRPVRPRAWAPWLALVVAGGLACGAEAGVPFRWGLEYLVPGLAAAYQPLGLTWGKPQPEPFRWDALEPEPPVNGVHRYRFEATDALLKEYADAGWRDFHIYLQCRQPWAAARAVPPGHTSVPLRPERLDDYAAWLRAVVRRYGPGGILASPVRYWEIEAEWGTFWNGSVEDYLTLLRTARTAIKEVDPEARIIAIGLLWWGIYDGDPAPDELERRLRLPFWGQGRRQFMAAGREVLAHGELFDLVDYHSLSDWSELAPVARELRAAMRAGAGERPLWVGDMNATVNPMLWWNQPNYPYVSAQVPALKAWLNDLVQPFSPRHAAAVRWLRAEQAGFVVKKLTAALAAGYAGMNIGNLEDWEAMALTPTISGTLAWGGLIDRRLVGQVRTPGAPRPVYWSLKLLHEHLADTVSVTPLGLRPPLYGWRFTGDGRSTLVLWAELRPGRLPDAPLSTTPVTLDTPATRATLLPLVTEPGATASAASGLAVTHGQVTVPVGPLPVLVDESRAG